MSAKQSPGGPISWMARNPVAANLLMVALLVSGLISAFQIKKEVFPEWEIDVVTIQVAYPGASPEEVERGILLAIEEQVRDLDGVKRVDSQASEGSGLVMIFLFSHVGAVHPVLLRQRPPLGVKVVPGIIHRVRQIPFPRVSFLAPREFPTAVAGVVGAAAVLEIMVMVGREVRIHAVLLENLG